MSRGLLDEARWQAVCVSHIESAATGAPKDVGKEHAKSGRLDFLREEGRAEGRSGKLNDL